MFKNIFKSYLIICFIKFVNVVGNKKKTESHDNRVFLKLLNFTLVINAVERGKNNDNPNKKSKWETKKKEEKKIKACHQNLHGSLYGGT